MERRRINVSKKENIWSEVIRDRSGLKHNWKVRICMRVREDGRGISSRWKMINGRLDLQTGVSETIDQGVDHQPAMGGPISSWKN